jgi:hypothetical protein
MPKKWFMIAFLVAASAGSLPFPRVGAEAKSFQEYEVKAAFLYRFAQFVEWPNSAFSTADAPVAIGVLGDDPFGAVLDQLVQGEIIHGRKVVVRRSSGIDDLKTCHVLFVSKSEKDRTPQILGALANAPVLTVGEIDGFAGRGGMINFYIQDNKVRFEINPDAARRCGLKISSKLLGLGRLVH